MCKWKPMCCKYYGIRMEEHLYLLQMKYPYYLYNYINKNPYEIIVDDFIAEYILVIKG